MSKQISPARLAANRRNAQKSTGPRTATGKSRSSRNAVTHGLLAAESPLDTSSSDLNTNLLTAFTADLNPVGTLETTLIARLASLQQRLDRIRTIETGLFDREMTSILEFHPDRAQPGQQTFEDCLTAPSPMLLAEAYSHQSRTLNLLSFYEARLTRDFHRTLAELRNAQAQRAPAEARQEPRATSSNQQPASPHAPAIPTPAQPVETSPHKIEQTNPTAPQSLPLQQVANQETGIDPRARDRSLDPSPAHPAC